MTLFFSCPFPSDHSKQKEMQIPNKPAGQFGLFRDQQVFSMKGTVWGWAGSSGRTQGEVMHNGTAVKHWTGQADRQTDRHLHCGVEWKSWMLTPAPFGH